MLKKLVIKVDEFGHPVKLIPTLTEAEDRFHENYWGWTIEGAEWDLTIRITARQDGQESWGVFLTMIDGDVDVRHGLCPIADAVLQIEGAIHGLMGDWVEPPVTQVIREG